MATSEIKIRKRLRFAAIPDAVFTARHLSTDARLTLAWALGRPDDWTFSVHHIQRELGLSRRVWRRVRDELAEDGWLNQYRRHDGQTHTDDGRVIRNALRWVTEITDDPMLRLLAGDEFGTHGGAGAASAAVPTTSAAPAGEAHKHGTGGADDEPSEARKSPSSRSVHMESSIVTVCTDADRDGGNREEEDPPPISPSMDDTKTGGSSGATKPTEAAGPADDQRGGDSDGELPSAADRHAGDPGDPETDPGNAVIRSGEIIDQLISLGFAHYAVVARGFQWELKRWHHQGVTHAEWDKAVELAHSQLPPGELPRSPNYYRWAVEQIIAERGRARSRAKAISQSNTAPANGKDQADSRKGRTTNKRTSHHGLFDKDYRTGSATHEEVDAWIADLEQ